MHLRDIAPRFGTQGLALQSTGLLAQLCQALALFAFLAVIQRLAHTPGITFGVVALGNPCPAHAGQPLAHINRGGRVGIRA